MKPFGKHSKFPWGEKSHIGNRGADRKGKLATAPGKKHRMCQAREQGLSPTDHFKRLYSGLQANW